MSFVNHEMYVPTLFWLYSLYSNCSKLLVILDRISTAISWQNFILKILTELSNAIITNQTPNK